MTPPVVDKGTCSCGQVKVETYTSPMLVFNCHCSKCRKFTGKPYNSATLFWRGAVGFTGKVDYEETSSKAVFGIRRGKCVSCRDEVIELGRRGLMPFIFPSGKLLGLKPTHNIFYDSGEKKGTMELTTIRGDISSLFAFFPFIAFKGIPQLFYLAWAWTFGGAKAEKKDS